MAPGPVNKLLNEPESCTGMWDSGFFPHWRVLSFPHVFRYYFVTITQGPEGAAAENEREDKVMPRKARERGESRIYHVVVQGARDKRIFGTVQDKLSYTDRLLEYRTRFGVELFAFCILENHAHLILRESESADVSGFMRRLGISYSHSYRKAHGADGTEVYRGRYLSEPLELWQLPGAISFVESEPVRLGLAERPEDWPYGSAGRRSGKGAALYALPEEKSTEESMVAEEGPEQASPRKPAVLLEAADPKFGRTHEEAREALIRRFGENYRLTLCRMDRSEKEALVRELRYEDCFSIHLVSAATGFGRGVVQRVGRNAGRK